MTTSTFPRWGVNRAGVEVSESTSFVQKWILLSIFLLWAQPVWNTRELSPRILIFLFFTANILEIERKHSKNTVVPILHYLAWT